MDNERPISDKAGTKPDTPELLDENTANSGPKLTEGFDRETEIRLSQQDIKESTSWLVSVSKYISAIFSPLLMPTYCVALGMWLTILSLTPENTRLSASLVVLFLTGIIPLAMILGLIKAGYVSNLDISNRRQRIIPIIATSLCYLASTIYIHRIQGPDWLAMLFVGALVAGFIAALISIWWKISAHGAAAGAIIGLLLRFVVSDLNVIPMLPWIIGAIILGGIIGVSRMALNAHTPGQYVAGEILGATCVYFATGMPVPFVSEHIMPL